jgi:hypothetical protein
MNVSFLKPGTYHSLTTNNAAFRWVVSSDVATFSPIAVGRSNYGLAAHSDCTSTSSYSIKVLSCSYAGGHRQDTDDGAALGRTFRAASVRLHYSYTRAQCTSKLGHLLLHAAYTH